MPPFMMGTTSSITMQSLGKIVQRAAAVGAKIWCLFFCFFVFIGHAPSPDHCAVEGCIVRTSTAFCSIFSEGIALSDALHSSHIRC